MKNSLSGLVHVGLDLMSMALSKLTGKILLQTGDVARNVSDIDGVESWQHVGWASTPSKPDAGKAAAQGVILKTSDRDICIASQDLRCFDLYGNLDYGEFCAFAGGEDGKAQGRVIGKKDGSVTRFTTDTNTAAGKSVYDRVKPDGFDWVAPWGSIRFDRSGFHVVHESGAEFHLGGIYGLPAPLDQLTTYCKIVAASVRLQSAGAPVADATAQAAINAAVQVQIAALQVALTATATAAGTGGAASTSAGVVTAEAGVVATQTVLLPKSSSVT